MTEMTAIYLGEKRCEATHISSGSKVLSDAPKDNNGKGEAFSPTDLVATSLGLCMITVMGIHAEKENVSLVGMNFKVHKEMSSAPRKISDLTLVINMPKFLSDDWRKKLTEAALNCPVKLSLHPDIKINISWNWNI